MRPQRAILFALLLATAALPRAADVREGLVSYWPLDTMSEDWFHTPDVVSGNDFELVFFDPSFLVPGQHGQALSFVDGFTQTAWFMNPPGVDTGLPVSTKPQFTVMFWVNGTGTGQNDRRIFSESSSTDNDPLFNIGTHNGGADDTIDIYIRNQGVKIGHAHSTNSALTGEWHHVAWTETNGVAALYLDGELDSTYEYQPGTAPMDIVSIGAIVRETGFNVGAYFMGSIDEVAVWERGLTQAEIQDVMNNAIETPVPDFAPAVVQQPEAPEEIVEGKSLTLSAGVTGTRPRTYQWKKDGEDIPGATTPMLDLTDLQLDDSGAYTLEVSNSAGTAVSEPVQVTVTEPPPPDLSRGLVSHWPLEVIEGGKTPDVISGYDMDVVNLTQADIVSGQIGNAFSFENSRGTLLERVHTADEQLPANKHPAFSVAMWTMVDGIGQNDLRVFSEGNTGVSDPLFNIGTHNTGAGPEADFFIREAGMPLVDHAKSTGGPFDGTWHHILFVQEEDGTRKFYIDGALDPVEIVSKPVGIFMNVNNTTIGGILRASRSHWVTGLIDETAIWSRALTAEEAALLFEEGVPEGGDVTLPLDIRSLTADFPVVVPGGEATLRWDVTRDVQVSIDQGVGDVTDQTVAGSGSISVPIEGDTTFTLTLTRGEETLSQEITVLALDEAAAGWNILDNFETHPAGKVAEGAWVNPEGLFQVVDLGENSVLGYEAGGDLAALTLNSLTLEEGGQATLFFRVYVQTNDTSAIALHVGLTEKPIRFIGDFAGDNVGPYVRFERFEAESSAYVGVHSLGIFEIFPGLTLEPGQVYNVWLDVQNEPLGTPDVYSIYLAEEGASDRTLLFQDYWSNRLPEGSPELGPALPDLISLFVAADGAQGVNSILLDDFFLSTGDEFNASVPVPASSFQFSDEPAEVTITGFTHDAAGSFTLTWESETGATYDVLKAGSVDGQWTPVASGYPAGGATAATTSFTDAEADGEAAFYQIQR